MTDREALYAEICANPEDDTLCRIVRTCAL